MSDLFNAPTRSQLDRVARGDVRLIRAFEKIFSVAGQDFYTFKADLDDLTIRVGGNEAAIAGVVADVATNTAAISASNALIAANTLNILANADRIKTNEVFSWLSV